MKIEIDVDIKQIAKGMNSDGLTDFMRNFSEDDIMDAVEKSDNERGDWVFLERMVKYVSFLSVDLKNEIEDALDGKHITEDTYKVLKTIQRIIYWASILKD